MVGVRPIFVIGWSWSVTVVAVPPPRIVEFLLAALLFKSLVVVSVAVRPFLVCGSLLLPLPIRVHRKLLLHENGRISLGVKVEGRRGWGVAVEISESWGRKSSLERVKCEGKM